MSRMHEASQAIQEILRNFIPPNQLRVIGDLCRGEERDFFFGKLFEFRDRIKAMPQTREQDGLGDDAVAYLHYFVGGSDFYITEKDMGERGDPHEEQIQAFGMASLGGYEPEIGYISLPEIFAAGAELDIHFDPQTLRQIKEAKFSPSPAGFG